MSRIRHTLPLAAALAALALPAHASASPDDVIRDCAADGRLDGHYSDSDLRRAQGHIPSDVNEYTDCRSAIAAARNRGHGGNGGGGSGSGDPALKTSAGAYAGSHADLAAYRAETDRARHRRSPSVDIGGEGLSPTTGGLTRPSSAANQLPLPLLIALIAVAALAAAGALAVAWRRWPQIRRAPLRLLRR